MHQRSNGVEHDRVLIHAPFGRDAILIQKELQAAGFASTICDSISEICDRLSEGAGAVLVGDEALRPEAVQCLAERLALQPPWSDLPLLVMTTGGAATDTSRYRLRLLEPLGNITLLERPLRPVTLVSSLRAALRARRHQYELRNHLSQLETSEKALRNSEARFRFLSELGEATRTLSEPEELVAAVAQKLGEHLQVSRCAYADVELDSEQFTIVHDYTAPGCASTAGRYDLSLFGPRAVADMHGGRTLVIRHVDRELLAGEGREMFSSIGIQAIVCCPLVKDGLLVAMMAVHQTVPRNWNNDEIELIEEVVERCWAYIERARAARESRQSERRFRTIVETNPFGLLIGDLEGGVQYGNSAILRLLGYTAEEIASGAVRWDRLTPPEFAQLDQDAIRQLSEVGSCEPYEKVYLAKDGRRIPILVGASLLTMPTGEPAVAAFITDLSILKEAEAELRRQWLTFDTALSHTPDFTYIFDLDGRFRYSNRALLNLLELRLDEIIGRNFSELGYPVDLASRLQSQIQQVIDTKVTIRDQTPFTGPTGEKRYHEYIFVPVFSDSGSVRAVAGSTRDVTEQRLADAERERLLTELAENNRQLQRTNEDLTRVNRELEEFAYVASHDLQEPLRMVKIYTHLILKGMDSPDETMREYASFVRQGAGRMEELIRDLLSFSRTVHNDNPAIGAADLSASFSEAVSVLKNRIEENGAIIKAEQLPIVLGDEPQLAHVFQNLLSNAIKYRNPTTAPEICISAEERDGMWTVAFRDNGIGFDQKYAERIFGLFKRLHKDEYPGTGLGLAICQRIIERYGGRMWATSQEGSGSTFYFSLPAAEVN